MKKAAKNAVHLWFRRYDGQKRAKDITKKMDAKLIEKARAVMKRAAVTREAELCGETCKGITVDDVLRIFPGARVLPAEEAKALKMQQAEGAESA